MCSSCIPALQASLAATHRRHRIHRLVEFTPPINELACNVLTSPPAVSHLWSVLHWLTRADVAPDPILDQLELLLGLDPLPVPIGLNIAWDVVPPTLDPNPKPILPLNPDPDSGEFPHP